MKSILAELKIFFETSSKEEIKDAIEKARRNDAASISASQFLDDVERFEYGDTKTYNYNYKAIKETYVIHNKKTEEYYSSVFFITFGYRQNINQHYATSSILFF